jgi:hypothetical protein
MNPAKEFGKNAKNNGVNAPKLDEFFVAWLQKMKVSENRDYFVQWWEGWYEALDESLSVQTKKCAHR